MPRTTAGGTVTLARGPSAWAGEVYRASTMRVPVASLAAASRASRAFIDRDGLGASQLGRGHGDVHGPSGRVVARVSYNGRVWAPDGSEITGAALHAPIGGARKNPSTPGVLAPPVVYGPRSLLAAVDEIAHWAKGQRATTSVRYFAALAGYPKGGDRGFWAGELFGAVLATAARFGLSQEPVRRQIASWVGFI